MRLLLCPAALPALVPTRLPAVAALLAVLATGILPAVMLLTTADLASAHEIPARVAARAMAKVEGDRLRILLRVPLQSMRDLDVPLYGPGFLDMAGVRPLLADAATTWIADYIIVLEDGRALPTGSVTSARIALPGDRSFETWDGARASFAGPPPEGIDLPWEQALLDVMIDYPVTSADASLSIDAALAHLGVQTSIVLRFFTADGAERTYVHDGRGGAIRMDPRWHHAARQFVVRGFAHILGGLDHLLFLLCLVIPIRRVRSLIGVVTAFTVGHSITLIASALGAAPSGLWFPPLVEALIAASIVWLALENIIAPRIERRWRFALAFGLVHGFGFAFALRESLQFAGSHAVTALAAFNIGVELGQIAMLAVAVPALALLFRYAANERLVGIVLSALIAHSAWHWMTDRGRMLAQYEMPALDGRTALLAIQGMLLAVAATLVARAAAAYYSSRRASIGSTRVARHAGSGAAASPTSASSASTAADSMNIAASIGDRP